MKRISSPARTVLLLLALAGPPASGASDWEDMISPPWQKQPTIGLSYGLGRSFLNSATLSPADPGYGEILLGGTRIKDMGSGTPVVHYRLRYLSLATFTNDLGPSPGTGEPTANIWRVGIGTRAGYGYRFGDEAESAGILLYNGGDLALASVDVQSTPPGMPDSSVLYQFEGALRWGSSVSGGLVLRVTPLISVDAGFQRTVVFRRWEFWPWLGSWAVEGLLQTAMDGFVDKIGDSSPMARPIASFILKNALSYGIYQLRKQDQNTPFPSEAPLFIDTYRIGLNFTF